jgi:L-lysine exporter family protein LysE/ArgO
VAISFILHSLVVRWALWVLGTLVLLALAYRMLRDAFRDHRQPDMAGLGGAPAPSLAHLAQGFGLAISSPSAILWFATVGGSIIASNTGAQSALLPFFSGFFLSGVLWSLAVALLSGQGQRILGPRLVRWFSLGSAGLFLYLALRVFLDGYYTLVG